MGNGRLSAILLTIGVVITGCGMERPQPPQSVIPVGRSFYGGIAWLSSDWIVVANNSNPAEAGSAMKLWRLRPDGSEFRRLAIPDLEGCRRSSFLAPTTLPDGNVAYVVDCTPPDPPHAPIMSMWAWDVAEGTSRRLVENPLDLAVGAFTWNPEMTRGMYGETNNPCVRLGWLSKDGVEPPNIRIEEGRRGWNLKENFEAGSECAHVGRATWPAWSPDGKTIAFLATTGSIGEGGQGRFDAPFNLYFMDPDKQEPQKVLEGLDRSGDLQWSPDGEWLAFVAGVQERRSGVHVYGKEDGELRWIVSDSPNRDINSIAWSPDGKRIVAIVDGDENVLVGKDLELVIFDVTEML